MPFRVDHTIIREHDLVHLTDADAGNTATIIPSLGAMLHAWTMRLNEDKINLVDSYSPEEVTTAGIINWFKGIKLSPWVCRISEGKYQFNNKDYKIQRMYTDGTALHGLLFDQPFKLIEEFNDNASAGILLKHLYGGYDNGYPFEYSCEVKFILHQKNLLEVETTIYNLSETPIPITDGWHPYFRLGGKVNDWNLFFPASAILEFNEKLIPTGKMIAYDRFNQPQPVGELDLDNCFLLNMDESKLACILKNPGNHVSLYLYADLNYPFLQIFIPSHRNSIALENISGVPDAFNNKIGLSILQPGNSQTFRVMYQALVQ